MNPRTLLAGGAALLLLCGVAVSLVAVGRGTEAPPPGDLPSRILDGFCEASTLAPWGDGVVVGDNETEDRLFAFDADFRPRGTLPLAAPVEDVEALAVLPQGLLVVASQGANRKGRPRPLREQVLLLGAHPIRPDLSGCAPCEAARPLPPKEGGLSVEGAAAWRGALWLGLRSPLVDGRALLLRMVGDPAVALAVAEVTQVDLGGQGVRELVPDGEALLVLAGPPDRDPGGHSLYRLDAPGGTAVRLPVDLPPSAEGVLPVARGRYRYVTDGDGQPGKPCVVPATWGEAG